MPEVDEFGIPIKNKAVKVSESSSADEFGIPIKPKEEQPPVKKKSTVSPWQSIIPTVETPKVQDQPQSSTGQVAPLDLFKAGLEKSQSSSAPDLRSGSRLPGIEPNAQQKTAPEKINTSLEQEVGKINSFMEGYDYKAERAAERKDMGIVSKKPTNAELRTDPRTPKLVYNNNEYRKNTLSDGTESWEKRDKLSGDFFVISDPNSITLLNKKFGGEVPTESPLFEETRKVQLERRQALLPLNQGLIGRSEEQAVPRIKNILANLGIEDDFTVEQIGAGYDAIGITNKVTGGYQKISLDNWSDERNKQESGVLKAFIESYAYNKDYFKKKKQIDELSVVNENDFNAFDIEGVIEKNKKLNDLKEEVANIEKGRDRFINDNEYRATAEKNVQTEINNYKTKIDQLHIASIDLDEAAKSLNEEKNNLQQFISAGTISPEEAQARISSIQAREANLQATKESLSSELNNAVSRKEFNENVVKDAYLINSERGNILSGTTQAFTRGMEAPFRMILNAYERQTGQKYVGGDKSIFGDDEYGWGAGVSTLDYTKSENRNDFSKAIFGISESLGSALSGYIMTGGAMGLAPNTASVSEKAANLIDLGIFASMYNSSRDQMEGEEWAGVPLEEKVFLSIAMATPQMVLEKFGLTEALRGTNFGRKLTANVLKQVFNEIPKDASTEVVENAIKKNLTRLIGEGVLRANGAGIVEATTEGSQYLSEVSTQELYNLAKGKKFFDTPNSFMGLVENLGENAKIGYIGGASLGAVSSVLSVAREKMTKDDFSKIENTINDVNLNKALTLHIQQQLLNNEITQEEADQKLENIQKFEKELAVFPPDMPVDDKFEASNLLAERAKIEAEIEGKEKTLVQGKLDRINEINNQLKEIGSKKIVTESTTTTRDKTANTAKYDSDGNLIKDPTNKETDLFKYDSDGNLIKNTTRTETTVFERPTIQIDEDKASSYTGKDDRFYPESLVMEMSPEELSQLTIVNPSPKVQARIEEVFPAEKTTTNENVAPAEITTEDNTQQKTVAQLQQEKIETAPFIPLYKKDGKTLAGKEDFDEWNKNYEEHTAKYNALIEEAKKNEDKIKKELYPKYKEAKSKIKNKELFVDGGVFANELGGSGENSIPTNHTEINGIEFVQFSNPDTGIVDVIMTGTSDNDFVGYYRLYENGKPTNKWSSKFENQSRNKANFKTMISGVQSMLPKGHEYTEKTSISTDGLRVWNQQLDKGYEVQQDKDGNIVTDRVAINGDAISNELGIDVSQGDFSNISVTNNKQFETVKKAITPYLEKLGLTSDNIYWENGTVTIDLPVLKQQEAQKTSEKSAEKTLETKSENTNLKNVENTTKALELNDKSNDDLQSMYEEFSQSKNKEIRVLSNMIENIQEQNERKSIINSPLSEVENVIDEILKSDEYFLEKKEGREAKEVAKKYMGDVSKNEAKKDFKDSFFGNPSNWVADTIKMRESSRVYIEQGGTFKELLSSIKNEFESDGFTEQEAASVIKDKLESINKVDFRQKQISEAYHKAKADGSNPELVKAIEKILSPKKESTQKPSEKSAEKTTTQENKQTGIKEVQDNAKEYKEKYKVNKNQRTNEKVSNVFDKVSKKIADLYQSIKHEPKKEEVEKAYDALVKETKDQYNFIVSKGLKVVRHQGKGEPYASSADMLNDLRENNTLVFLPNDEAFGQKGPSSVDNIGLEPSGIKLEDGYELTNSEVFRVVHDYFGHGILGNQFGAIGEENATLQHLDLYTQEALPAVIFQTRGQNSWVNFSGENDRANKLREQARELVKQGKTEEAKKLSDEADDLFKFAEPKINILPKKFNFKRHETARRISEQESIDRRPNKRNTELPGLLARYSKENRKTRGISKKSVRKTQRIGEFSVNIVAEYTLDDNIDKKIKITSPKFKGVQTIYEITDGDVYREMLIKSLEDNPHSASVTVHSAEEFGNMRMFITEDGSTGVTLTKEGFLGGGFSMSRPQNLPQLLILGIKEGATTAEAFDTVLPDYYTSFGFKAVSRTAFNHKYRPLVKNGNAVKDWDYETYKEFNNGRPDIVFFIYDGGDRNTIEDRVGLFDGYQSYEKAFVKSFDKNGYDQAQEVMKQEAVKRLEFEAGIESTAPTEQKAESVKEEEKPATEITSEEIVMPGENQKRRDEGKYTKDGVEYVRNEPTKNVRGKEGEVRFTESTKEGFTYKLVEADELQPSHQNGQRNPMHFIPEAQPKSRTDVGSIAAEQSFANNPRFESLGQDQDAYSGAPIVNERNEVVQGNNRSAGLKKGYKQGSVQYKQDLSSNAEQFGFTKDQVEGMNNPILVREIKVDDDKAIELGNYDVKDMETGGKSRIDAVALSRRIPLSARQQITDLLFKDDNVTLNESIRKNQGKVTEILRKYLNQAQRTSLSKDGELTKNAISDIEELVKQFLFDGADTQLSDVFENLPKTVQEGVRKSMPYIFGVDFNKSILSDVQNGLVALNQFIASGIKDFGEWKNQQDMFNDGKTPVDMFSPLSVAIAEKLNSSKQSEIVDYFKKYATETKGTEADMFNEATEGKTKEQATKDIFGESSTERKTASVKQAPKKTEKPAEKETAPASKPTEKNNFKSIADNIRKLKSEPKKFIDPITGKEFEFTKQGFDWNDMVEAVALAVEKTGDLVGAVKDYLKKQDWYNNLSDEQQKSLENQIINELDPESNAGKTEPSKPKGQNTSRQSERAIEMQEDENPELAKRIKSLSSYERQDQKEFFDNVSSIIDDMGEVASVEFATNPSNNVPVEIREAILTIAAARYGSSAMEKQNRAIESNDDQLLSEAEYELEKSMLWNLEASQYATKAGQIIAFKNKIYNEFPAFFSLSKKKEFDNKFGAEQEVKEEIKGLQDDISRGVDSIVDDLTTNEEIEALKAQVEDLKSKLANSKNSAGSRSQKSDEKIKEIKQRRKDLFAQLKNESRGGQVSASIGFMNSNQIELIGKIVASYIEEGIVRTDKIVNEIYRNLKDSYPALRKEHIRSIARENPDFETLQNSEAQVKEKTKLEKLQERLAKLQKGEGELDENIRKDDSDEVKEIKKQIADEKVLSPKVLRQLVKDYLRGNKMNYRSLADAIAQKSGKSIEEVQDLADLMEEKIKVRVEELVKKEHKKFIEKTNSSAEKSKTKDLKYRKQKGIATEEELAELDRRLEDQKSKSEIKRIMQTIMMGGLGSSSDFRKAFEERFGFKELSETTQKQVDALAFEIFDIQREVDRQVVDSEGKKVVLTPLKRQRLAILQKKLNTLLESNKPWSVGKVLKEINSAIYIHILSGPVTFARAFIGGYVSGALGFGAYNFINIANYKHLAKGYREMIKALPSAYIKAIQSRKTGVDFFGATGLSGEIGGDTFGAYESAIFKGLNDAMKNKETGKVLIKSYGQALKVIHALGALDTFMNTITGTFVGTVEASKRGEFNKINDAEYKQIAHEDWFYFLKAVGKLADIQNPDLDFESRIKKIDSLVRNELGITGSRYDAKKVFTANRIQELRENNLGKYFEQGVSLSKDASMMGKPDGLTGVLVDKLQKASTISDTDNTVAATLKFIPNLIFKFTRITGQVINKSFNNIPLIGIANAAIGVGRNMETGEFEYGFLQRAKSNPLLFKQRVATNLLTTATLIGAYALMFEDDDEEGLKLDENRPFDLRGFGGDNQKLERKYENYRNLSISFTKDKNGKWTNYVELKLVPEMSAIAGMLGYFGDVMKGDVELSSKKEVQKVLLERFKKEGLSTRNIFKAMSENTKIFTESSFSSVGSISRNYKSGEQDGGFMGGIGNVALNLMVDNIKPLVEPRVVESVIKTVSKVNGSEEKELKDWEYFAKNLYGLDSFFSDNKTDVFGNTYKKESDYEKFMKDTFGVGKKRSEDFKDVALLYKFEQGANISKRKFTEMKPDSKEGFTVTYNSPFGKVTKKYLSADKSIVDETQSIQEAEFKRLVSENYKSLNSLETKDKLEKKLKDLQDKSTEYAKKEIVKKYDGTKKIESIDK